MVRHLTPWQEEKENIRKYMEMVAEREAKAEEERMRKRAAADATFRAVVEQTQKQNTEEDELRMLRYVHFYVTHVSLSIDIAAPLSSVWAVLTSVVGSSKTILVRQEYCRSTVRRIVGVSAFGSASRGKQAMEVYSIYRLPLGQGVHPTAPFIRCRPVYWH